MSPLLLSYKIEYETTNISINELCEKYNITKEELGDYQTWTKLALEPEQPVTQTTPAIAPSQQPIVTQDISPLDKLAEVKDKLISTCKAIVEQQGIYTDVKELKDITKVITDLEASYKEAKDQGPTINVLVQNITERFKDDV